LTSGLTRFSASSFSPIGEAPRRFDFGQAADIVGRLYCVLRSPHSMFLLSTNAE
jgi:hypothetical protein